MSIITKKKSTSWGVALLHDVWLEVRSGGDVAASIIGAAIRMVVIKVVRECAHS